LLALAGMAMLIVIVRARSSSRPAPTGREYVAPRGHQTIIALSDGTRIRLAPESRLHVTFGAVREVTLQGEALFDVSHGTDTPFVVHTMHADTRVLGTTFLVREYPSEYTSVVVADGRVALRALAHEERETILSAHMRGVVGDSGRVTVLPAAALNDYTALASGHLVFQKTPMRDVIVELNRAYDIHIQVADSTLLDEQLTLTVPVESRSLDQVMRVLTLALGAHYTQTGSVITIAPGRSLQKTRTPLAEDHEYGR